MDTKLKNIKQNRGVKAAAFALAVLMFFMAGNFAALFIKGFVNFNAFEHPVHVTQTAVFRSAMNNYIHQVLNVGESSEYQTFEEYLESPEAKSYSENYYKDMDMVEAAYKLLDESDIEVFVDTQNRYRYALTYRNVRYFFSYDGSPISRDQFYDYEFVDYEFTKPHIEPETTVVENNQATTALAVANNNDGVISYYDPYGGGGWPAYIGDITDALARLNAIGGYTCYGEGTKEDAIAVIEQNRIQHLRNQYSWSRNGYSTDIVNSVESINYAIVYKNSGRVFTNCGITAADTQEQILEKLGGTAWAEGFKDGKSQLLVGKSRNLTNGVYGMLHDGLFGSYSSKSILDMAYFENVESAYFAFSENGTDAFTVMKKSFDSYNQAIPLTAYLALTVICLFIAIAACIYLLSAAGKTADGIKINFFDKVPFEINWILGLAVMAAAAFAACCGIVFEVEPFSFASESAFELIITVLYSFCSYMNLIEGVLVAVFFMIWTGLNASLVRNIRNKTFFKYSVIFFLLRPIKWIFKKLWKMSRKTADKIGYIFNCDYSKGQGKKFKILACVATIVFIIITPIYYVIATVAMVGYDEAFAFILFMLGILGDIAILGFVLLLITSQDRIMHAVSDMRKGELGMDIDKKYMPPFMSRFADDILYMQEGLQNAVDSAVKDQRMKAELITNVSHDLKTPLTSIVNYVDLLKKCDIEDETAQRYVSILDEKAHRMKKLIEDLVEASKASSGAVELHAVKLNLCEFAAQAVGEHEDELKKYDIELVLKTPSTPVMVIADSQKTSRIFENLFSNIRKYALEGTRVYIDVAAGLEYGSVIFKNISKHPLDISPDELTQRFVRGDASRSGEGSGLGLSIAKDLCELQKGKLGLQIDGDLFKAIVALPKA